MKAERACLAGPLYKSAGLFCLNSEEEEKKKKDLYSKKQKEL
jgi:hypothetical protein